MNLRMPLKKAMGWFILGSFPRLLLRTSEVFPVGDFEGAWKMGIRGTSVGQAPDVISNPRDGFRLQKSALMNKPYISS